jgi:ABC-type multidrug transport system ATPase subunit
VVSPAHRSESREPGRGGPAIRVEGVAKRFGETQALEGVDLEVPEGAVFGLLGPNGAGKTTLIRILSTLVPPDSGRAEILGHDVAQEPAAVREQIALTGQFAAVDELLTGRENLEMFGRLFDLSREEAAERADRLLREFDLADAADRPPGPTPGDATAARPVLEPADAAPILFLDEPTTGSTHAAATRSGLRSGTSSAGAPRCC